MTSATEAAAADPAPVAAGSVAGNLVYAIGDVHGRYDLLTRLLARIAADVADHGRGRRPVLVFCGDYVDRGPDSARVLAALLWLRRHGAFELHLLKGNHEAGLLHFVERPEEGHGWLGFGGDETLASYGVVLPEATPAAALVAARDDLLERMPAAHLLLLRGLEPLVTLGDYAFAHAGIRPGVALEEQSERDLLWIREPFLGHAARHERIVVHGHTWHDDVPVRLPNRIGIDTGAYHTGVLTAVRIEDGTIDFIQARTAPA